MGLCVQVVLRPGGRELRADVLFLGQATHRRRVEAKSGGAAYQAVDHRGEHLALQTTQGRALAHVQMVVEPASGEADVEVLRQDLEDAWDRSPY